MPERPYADILCALWKKKKILTSTLTAYEAVTSFPWG